MYGLLELFGQHLHSRWKHSQGCQGVVIEGSAVVISTLWRDLAIQANHIPQITLIIKPTHTTLTIVGQGADKTRFVHHNLTRGATANHKFRTLLGHKRRLPIHSSGNGLRHQRHALRNRRLILSMVDVSVVTDVHAHVLASRW